MADNTDLVKQIGKLIDEKLEPIKVEQRKQGKKLGDVFSVAAHTQTVVDLLNEKIDATKEEVDTIKVQLRPRHAD